MKKERKLVLSAQHVGAAEQLFAHFLTMMENMQPVDPDTGKPLVGSAVQGDSKVAAATLAAAVLQSGVGVVPAGGGPDLRKVQ